MQCEATVTKQIALFMGRPDQRVKTAFEHGRTDWMQARRAVFAQGGEIGKPDVVLMD